jgi:hypothetical protein
MKVEARANQDLKNFGLLELFSMRVALEWTLNFMVPPQRMRERVKLQATSDGAKSFHLKSSVVRSWPGSRFGASAKDYIRCTYVMSPVCFATFFSRNGSLSTWHVPLLTGGPHVMRPDVTLFLGSLTLHRIAWLELDRDTDADIVERFARELMLGEA